MLGKSLRVLHWFEDSVLVVALISMLGMAVLQIVLRNFFDAGIFWAESFLRILVLWVAMLGAMVATREAHHISIDIASRYLGPLAGRVLFFLTCVFSAVICGLVAYHSLEFIGYEMEDETIAFASVPAWVCEAIIPVGFGLMSVRFVIRGFLGPKEHEDGL